MKDHLIKASELLEEDNWVFVRNEGHIQLWKKLNFYVWFDPENGFSPISIGEEPQKP
jgi:hypothetical protein